MAENGEQFQAVSDELNYSVENLLNSSKKFSKIRPLSSNDSFTLTPGSTQDVTIEIPSLPYADKDMYIGLKIRTSAVPAAAFVNAHPMLPVSQIHYGTQQRENEYFSLSNQLHKVQKMSTKMLKHVWKNNQSVGPTGGALPTSGGLIARSNQTVADNKDALNQQARVDYVQYQQLIQRTAAQSNVAATAWNYYVRLGDIFPMSVFNQGKVVNRGELGRLRLIFTDTNYFWQSATADPSDTPAQLAGVNFEFSDVALYIPFEKNQEVTRKLNQIVSSEAGLTIPIIYPYVNVQNRGATAEQSSSFDLTSGQGMRLLGVQSGLFRSGGALNENVDTTDTFLQSYHVTVNDSNIYNYDYTIDDNWAHNEKLLRNTPILDKYVWGNDYFAYHDFTNGEIVKYMESDISQLDTANLVGLPMEKTSFLKYGLVANTDGNAHDHVHIIYMLRFLNIRNSGVSVF